MEIGWGRIEKNKKDWLKMISNQPSLIMFVKSVKTDV